MRKSWSWRSLVAVVCAYVFAPAVYYYLAIQDKLLPWHGFVWFVYLAPTVILPYNLGWHGTIINVTATVLALISNVAYYSAGHEPVLDIFWRRPEVGSTLTVLAAILLFSLAMGVIAEKMKRDGQKRLERARHKARERQNLDWVTGAGNHRFLLAMANRLIGEGKPFSLIMYNLRGFRHLNFEYGYRAGNLVLRLFARLLARYFPGSVARYGSDVFVVATPCDEDEAKNLLDTVDQEVRKLETKLQARFPGLKLAVASGMAFFPVHGASLEQLLETAELDLDRQHWDDGSTVKVYRDAARHWRNMEVANQNLRLLLFMIDAKDRYTRSHSERVSYYAESLALAVNHPLAEKIGQAALFHDLGKIEIPEHVLNKPGRLEQDQMEIIRRHPVVSAEFLKSIDCPSEMVTMVRYHHERFDGGGYPAGLAAEDIPLEARILAVADAFDAMTTQRPYRAPVELNEATAELARVAGTQLDPDLVDKFTSVVRRHWSAS